MAAAIVETGSKHGMSVKRAPITCICLIAWLAVMFGPIGTVSPLQAQTMNRPNFFTSIHCEVSYTEHESCVLIQGPLHFDRFKSFYLKSPAYRFVLDIPHDAGRKCGGYKVMSIDREELKQFSLGCHPDKMRFVFFLGEHMECSLNPTDDGLQVIVKKSENPQLSKPADAQRETGDNSKPEIAPAMERAPEILPDSTREKGAAHIGDISSNPDTTLPEPKEAFSRPDGNSSIEPGEPSSKPGISANFFQANLNDLFAFLSNARESRIVSWRASLKDFFAFLSEANRKRIAPDSAPENEAARSGDVSPEPEKTVSGPAVALPEPTAIPEPTEAPPKTTKIRPKPGKAVSGPTIALPAPAGDFSEPTEAPPRPTKICPKPGKTVSSPTVALPAPAEAIPEPTEVPPKTAKIHPKPGKAVSGTTDAPPAPAEAPPEPGGASSWPADDSFVKPGAPSSKPGISCNFFQANLKDFFSLLSKVSRKQIELSPDIARQRITMSLNNIPWDQALNAVANLYDLEVVPKGDGFYISPKQK